MRLLVADGKLIIEDGDGDLFVVVPCRGHGYHIKPVAEAALKGSPRELSVDEAHTLTSFIANGFA